MPLDPDEKPREFLVLLVAMGLRIFGDKVAADAACFNAAESFVAEAENRYGKLNP